MDCTMSGVRLETKTVAARVTEAKADGTATALVSVFGNVDLGGDRVMPGAFARSLGEWRAKGDPIPVIWSHDWDNPESFVGWADPKDITESADGLVVPMQFDTDRQRAEQVHHLLKSRRVTQFSFGYFVREYEDVDDPEYGKVRELRDVDLFEVGPTLLGMNPETELLAAASALRAIKEARATDTKATADEAVEGAFATWTYDDAPMLGRIEHVMTDGTLGVADSEYAITATPDDPALLLRIYEDADETDTFMGARASQVAIVDDPRDVAPDPAPESSSAITDSPADDAGDTQGTIPSEQVTALLTRPRYTEE
jgi:HK97 family phage prohead protease